MRHRNRTADRRRGPRARTGTLPDTEAALAVPDATVDPVRLVAATALAAERAGAEIRTGTAVTDVLVEDGRAVGVELDGGERIGAEVVVNAAGAWGEQVAALAGVPLDMTPSRGAMTVVGDALVSGVVNRCRPKSSGDIVVPCGDACILGTTDVEVDDPDDFAVDDREVALLFEELTPAVPALADAAVDHTYWGVRPLYEPDADGDSVGFSRTFSLLDHAERDDRPGFVSVVGGKLTTHRAMAEAAADLVCDRLGVAADCVTADEPLPDADEATARYGLSDLLTGTRRASRR
ncbi:FAD-dependent oxidoreductase [Halosegnis marinus]|uniref:FAD-dependent oxidoreductase n=1 Tax=Halosegnis marinus TaxID=3034023 RepID=UPI003605B18C